MMMRMMKEESGCGPRVCDTCGSSASAVFCRTERAYMCGACDARVHGGAWGHERVKVCEACERCEAAVVCKADAAWLCGACDAAVHSANPLARRHRRVAITSLEEEDATWTQAGKEVDEYLDLMEYDDLAPLDVGDSVVPCASSIHDVNAIINASLHLFHDADLASPKPSFAYHNIHAHTSTVSVSSMDMSVVPDSAMSETPMSHSRPPKGTIDLFSGPPVLIPTQLNPLDREARVLRYREKKKNRKFEKTIRYASRKAYALTRPRIKGRFAKRTEVEADVDHMFSPALLGDNSYGIVPSFQ